MPSAFVDDLLHAPSASAFPGQRQDGSPSGGAAAGSAAAKPIEVGKEPDLAFLGMGAAYPEAMDREGLLVQEEAEEMAEEMVSKAERTGGPDPKVSLEALCSRVVMPTDPEVDGQFLTVNYGPSASGRGSSAECQKALKMEGSGASSSSSQAPATAAKAGIGTSSWPPYYKSKAMAAFPQQSMQNGAVLPAASSSAPSTAPGSASTTPVNTAGAPGSMPFTIPYMSQVQMTPAMVASFLTKESAGAAGSTGKDDDSLLQPPVGSDKPKAPCAAPNRFSDNESTRFIVSAVQHATRKLRVNTLRQSACAVDEVYENDDDSDSDTNSKYLTEAERKQRRCVEILETCCWPL